MQMRKITYKLDFDGTDRLDKMLNEEFGLSMEYRGYIDFKMMITDYYYNVEDMSYEDIIKKKCDETGDLAKSLKSNINSLIKRSEKPRVREFAPKQLLDLAIMRYRGILQEENLTDERIKKNEFTIIEC